MRKSRKILSTAHNYLTRRNYANAEKSKSKVCSLKELINTTSSINEACELSIISYSCLKEDLLTAHTQFNKYLDLCSNIENSTQSELKNLITPLFILIYLELVFSGHKKEAEKFYENMKLLNNEEEEFSDLLKILPSIKTRQHLLSNKLALEFRNKKIDISLSLQSFTFLKEYIAIDDSIVVLQMLNRHFNLKVDSENILNFTSNSGEVRKNPPEAAKSIFSQICLNLKNAVVCPPICAYRLHNPVSNIGCASISCDDMLLCAGLDDSTLQLFRIKADVGANIHPFKSNLYSNFDLNSEEENSSWDITTEDILYPLVLRGHAGSIYDVSFLAKHRWFLSASHDNSVRLWDVKEKRALVSYVGHSGPVFSVKSSPIESIFASSSYDQTIKLWCTDRIFPLRNFIGHMLAVNCLKFHPNGNYLASGSGDMTLRFWDVQNGMCARLMQGHRGAIYTLAFSNDGKILATGGEDRIIRIWDLGMGRIIKMFLDGHSDVISALAFNKSGTVLSSGSMDGTLCLWDINKLSRDSESNESIPTDLIESFPSSFSTILDINHSKNNYFQILSRVT